MMFKCDQGRVADSELNASRYSTAFIFILFASDSLKTKVVEMSFGGILILLFSLKLVLCAPEHLVRLESFNNQISDDSYDFS